MFRHADVICLCLVCIPVAVVVVNPHLHTCFGGVLPYFEVTGHPVPVSSLGFKCPDFLFRTVAILYILQR